MSEALVPVITRTGLAAVVRAQGDGLQATIDRVAVGRGALSGGVYAGYTPSKEATTLAGEMCRVPILSGSRLDPAGFRVLARVSAATPPQDYALWEVGFYLSTGQLFALWSSPSFPIATKTRFADIDLAFDLLLEQLPVGSININVMEPDIPDTTSVLSELFSVECRHFIASLQQERRHVARGIY